uniref:Protein kinase domain-containing protein n=1 Tax=Oryzias melastigma TaxID=30732 RepID=A0A3B3BTF7_ORYME
FFPVATVMTELSGGFPRRETLMSDHKFEVEVNSLLPSDCALYLVEKFLGEGTFGKVAKCRDLTTNQEVAIKITKPSHRDSGLFELNALAEITKLDADKYCLIKFLDWFEYRSHICIVYEMLDQSLHDFMNIREHRPLLIHEIRTIARELLISLKGLKEINMAHRDIKPDNIMLVNQASEPFRVKLIDFGLAINPTDMETGTFMQNLRYRAPEVILGLPLDERVDMWTVGYTLAWLYTGFHIHSVDSEYTVIRSLTMRQGMFFTLTEDESTFVWKLDTPEEQIKKTGQEVKFKVKMFIKLLRRMLEIDPNKRITPEEALKHSFFTMEQPSLHSLKAKGRQLEHLYKKTGLCIHQVLYLARLSHYEDRISHSKTAYYSELIDSNKDNSKTLFKLFNKIFLPPNSTPSSPSVT